MKILFMAINEIGTFLLIVTLNTWSSIPSYFPIGQNIELKGTYIFGFSGFCS
jgi:hypothetical protein